MPVDDSVMRRVSCKNNIPLFAIFSLKYSNILIHFFDKLSPLTLDKKFKLQSIDVKLFGIKNNCFNKKV